MKELLSKVHYCYKIHVQCFPFYGQIPIWIDSHFTIESWSPSMFLLKLHPRWNRGGGGEGQFDLDLTWYVYLKSVFK